ncbi:MAG TPA: transglutaminase domain-containing protein, partial [Micromonosporaceae bacterium]
MTAGTGARALRALSVPLALVVLIGLSGVVLGQIYAGPLLTRFVVGAAVGSVGIGVAARRLPSGLVAPLSVGALAGYALVALRLAALRADQSGQLIDIVGEAVRNGIPRLLTAMIPVEPVPDTVVVPIVAAWATGLAATELAVRARRVLLSYLPPTLLYAGALYLVGPNAEAPRWATLGFAAAAAVGLALSGRPTGPALDARALP